jgi:hypothetical protein
MPTAAEIPNLLRDCRDLCLRVAPELAAAPLYVTVSPPDYPRPRGCAAFTPLGSLDCRLRQHLIDAGEWQGPGTAIVFCEPPTWRNDWFGIALHEAAHNLPLVAMPTGDVATDAAGIAASDRQLAAWASTGDACDSAAIDFDRHRQHGLRFIRACCHLHHRAARAGYPLDYSALRFAGPHYQRSTENSYAQALGDEPARMIDKGFAHIAAATLPDSFFELYLADCIHAKGSAPHAHR